MSANQFLFNIVKRKPLFMVVSIIFGFSGAILDLIGTALLISIVVVFLQAEIKGFVPNTPGIVKLFLTLSDRFTQTASPLSLIGFLLVAIAFKNLINYCNTLSSNYYTEKLVNPLRLEGFALLCDVDLDFYTSNKVGDIIVQINRELERTAAAIRSGHKILTTAIAILTLSFCLILISWQLTLVSSGLLALVVILRRLLTIRSQILSKRLSARSRDYSRKVIEFLTGIRLIKTIANEAQEYYMVRDLITAKNKAQLERQSILTIKQPVNEIAVIVMLAVLVGANNYLLPQPIVSSLILLVYLAILLRLLPALEQLNRARTQFLNYSPSGAIVADLLRRDNKPFLPSGTVEFTKLRSKINFEAVSFAYPDRQQLVLEQVSFSLVRGKTIALVGASGSGKSTIVDLIRRFYDPTTGSITIDGLDLREYNLKSLRRAIGVVTQDTFLFNNSVSYNLTYGLKNIAESDLIAAAKQANAYEFISQLPQGFATPIGDNGVILSRGQQQRIAIARTFLRDPDIVILDEAASGLDTISESLVQSAIVELCRGRTTLIIAHKLEQIRQSDLILVLDRGRIIESGSHQELLKAGKLYARLYSMQFKQGNQSHSQKLAQKIAQKLISQANLRLSYDVRNNLNSLLGSLQLVSEGLVEDTQEQEKILDESYQSAKNLFDSLKKYEQSIVPQQDNND